MTVEVQQKETLGFEAEVNQLLKLVVHSLYSNKEIFLRELISNASDACDKLRFDALKDEKLFEGDGDLKIRIAFDKDDKTITISDNGIGMNRQEVMDNIGTIAKSGTKEFFKALTGDQAKDSQLIGQFGVGFYSSFIVADKVTLNTRRAGADINEGICWVSSGEADYTIESIEKAERGTEIILHLNEEAEDFLQSHKLREIAKKFSDHIQTAIVMKKDPVPKPPADDEKAEAEDEKIIDVEVEEDENINSASALWTKSKADITDEEYNEFYKHVSHDYQEPMAHVHSRVEGKNEYTSLLYIPSHAPFDLYDRDRQHGIKLYVKRVFIMDDADKLMPTYLRFVKGVIDSDDLPLNVSREILQSSKVIDSIKTASVKKVLGLIEKMAKNDAEKYEKFWAEFGKVLKEGPAEDFANKEKIGKLLRFSSTHTDDEKQTISLDDYIGRMKDGQDKIYFVTADSFAAAKNSPHLEIFRKKGVEVLLMCERVDEWLTSNLSEYDGKTLQSVTKGELNLGDMEDEESKKAQEKIADEHKDFIEKISKALEGKVKEVRVTNRLTSSPACLVTGDYDMSANLARIMQQAGQSAPASKPIMEINPDHTLINRLKSEDNDDRFNDWSAILFDQALLSEGGQLEDPASFVKKLNVFLIVVSDQAK